MANQSFASPPPFPSELPLSLWFTGSAAGRPLDASHVSGFASFAPGSTVHTTYSQQQSAYEPATRPVDYSSTPYSIGNWSNEISASVSDHVRNSNTAASPYVIRWSGAPQDQVRRASIRLYSFTALHSRQVRARCHPRFEPGSRKVEQCAILRIPLRVRRENSQPKLSPTPPPPLPPWLPPLLSPPQQQQRITQLPPHARGPCRSIGARTASLRAIMQICARARARGVLRAAYAAGLIL